MRNYHLIAATGHCQVPRISRFSTWKKVDINAIIDDIASNQRKKMASITIRNLSDQIKERLRRQAARHGISLEAYARQILQQASSAETPGPLDLVALAQTYFGAEGGVDLPLPARGSKREPVDFEP